MNTQDPLANLKDIHLPNPVDLWPPAPGWWLLVLFSVSMITALVYWLVIRWKKQAYQREALLALTAIETDFNHHGDTRQLVRDISGLLRRTCITRYGRRWASNITGEAWLSFLDEKGKTSEFSQGAGEVFQQQMYRPDCNVDEQQLIRISRDWLRRHT